MIKIVLATAMVAALSTAVQACEASLDEYLRLNAGMTYGQAVAVIGCEGAEISRSEIAGYVTIMYQWEGRSFGANMNAMFQNDGLVTKAQFGLK